MSTILGLTIARRVIGMRELGDHDDADAPARDQVVALVEPWLATLLDAGGDVVLP